MMVGPIVNGIGVLTGSASGAFLGDKIPEYLRTRLPMVFGCASMGLGIAMIMRVENLPPVILALLLGTIIGEILHIEDGIRYLSNKARVAIEKVLSPPDKGLTQEEFMEKFVAMIVLFCASGTGIFGSMQEGLTGDPSLLIIKAFLDFFTSAIFATVLGYTLATVCIPQFIIQAALFMLAVFIMPLTTPTMIADFSAVGGLIMFATGFRICSILNCQYVTRTFHCHASDLNMGQIHCNVTSRPAGSTRPSAHILLTKTSEKKNDYRTKKATYHRHKWCKRLTYSS
jgi:hypothetical protein